MSQEYEYINSTESENEEETNVFEEDTTSYEDPEPIDDNQRLIEEFIEENEFPNEITTAVEDPVTTHYGLSDGRFWSIEDADFVVLEDPEAQEDVHVVYLEDDNPEEVEHPRTAEEVLIETLKAQNLPLGQYTPVIFYESKLRQERNDRLTATDYLLLTDSPLTDAKKEVVATYRQALRDLPSKEGYPWDGGGPKTPWPVLDI